MIQKTNLFVDVCPNPSKLLTIGLGTALLLAGLGLPPAMAGQNANATAHRRSCFRDLQREILGLRPLARKLETKAENKLAAVKTANDKFYDYLRTALTPDARAHALASQTDRSRPLADTALELSSALKSKMKSDGLDVWMSSPQHCPIATADTDPPETKCVTATMKDKATGMEKTITITVGPAASDTIPKTEITIKEETAFYLSSTEIDGNMISSKVTAYRMLPLQETVSLPDTGYTLDLGTVNGTGAGTVRVVVDVGYRNGAFHTNPKKLDWAVYIYSSGNDPATCDSKNVRDYLQALGNGQIASSTVSDVPVTKNVSPGTAVGTPNPGSGSHNGPATRTSAD